MNNGRRKTLKALGAACGLTTPAYAATSADAHHVAKLNTGTMPGAAHQLGPQVLSDKVGSQTSLGLAGLPGPLPAAQLPRPHMALNAAAAEWTPTKQPPSGGLSAAAQPWTGGVCSPSGSWSGGVSVGSPRNKNTMTVDTMAGLKDMLQVLCDVQQLAVDCEGVDLSRAGKLCVLILAAQTAGAQTLVWVVDICALEAAAFDTPVVTGKGEITLKQVLESLAVRKLMWDPRQDSNALWHQYKVYLGNVLCLQVAEVAHRQYVKRHPFVTHVWGLGKCFEVYLPRKMPADGSFVDKTVMRQAFRTDSQLWTRRPISDLLIRYCSQDVSHLFLLRSLLTAGLDAEVLKKVEAHSLLRVDECFLVEEPVNNMERAKAMKL